MNLLEGTLERANGGMAVSIGDQRLELTERRSASGPT